MTLGIKADSSSTAAASPTSRPNAVPGPSQPRTPASAAPEFESSFFTPSEASSSTAQPKFAYRDEASVLKELGKHLKRREGQEPLHYANKTWGLYEQLAPAARHLLPKETSLAILKAVVPPPHAIPLSAGYDTNAKLLKTFENRVQSVLMDIRASAAGLATDDMVIALESLMPHGHIIGVERVYKQLMWLYPKIKASDRDRLVIIRLRTILARGKLIAGLSTASSSEHLYDRPNIFQRPRIRADSPRQKAADAEAYTASAALWFVLKDITSITNLPSRETVSLVANCFNLTRELFVKQESGKADSTNLAFAERLDLMLEVVLRTGYGIDLKFLEMEDGTLDDLDKDVALVLIQLLGRRGEVWKMMSVAEKLQGQWWHDDLAGILAEVPSSSRKVATKSRSKEQAASEQNTDDLEPAEGQVDLRGGPDPDKRSFFDRLLHIPPPDPPTAAEALLSDPAYFIPKVGKYPHRQRLYGEYRPKPLPKPTTISSLAAAKFDWLSDQGVSLRPLSTKYPNVGQSAYAAMFDQIRDYKDMTALLHVTRMYAEDAVEQQTHWMFVASMELARLKAARKAAKHATVHRDRPPSKPWSSELCPPSLKLHPGLFSILMAYNRAQKNSSHRVFIELNRMIRDAHARLSQEHTLLTGCVPTGQELDFEAYLRTMRDVPSNRVGRNALARPYLVFYNAKGKTKSDIAKYAWRLDQRITRFSDMITRSLNQRDVGRRKRFSKNEKNLLHRLEREVEGRKRAERQAEEEALRAAMTREELAGEA